MYEDNILSINPIRMRNIGFLGELGSDWTGLYYKLCKLLTQNILYSCYHVPRNISELSEILCISRDIIIEEVDYLEEHGFLDKISRERYQTNILLHDLKKETHQELDIIFKKYARLLCQEYFTLLIANHNKLSSYFNTGSQYAILEESKRWSLVTLACTKRFDVSIAYKYHKHFTKHKDGSEFISFATIDKGSNLLSYEDLYNAFGEISFTFRPNDSTNISISKFDTYYDNRVDDWTRILFPEFISLCDHVVGNIRYNKTTADIYEKLFSKGYLVLDKRNNPLINIVSTNVSIEELINCFPVLTNKVQDIKKKLANDVYKLCVSEYPDHVKNLFYIYTKKILSNYNLYSRILEMLVSDGWLKPLPDNEKKTVNMIMTIEN